MAALLHRQLLMKLAMTLVTECEGRQSSEQFHLPPLPPVITDLAAPTEVLPSPPNLP